MLRLRLVRALSISQTGSTPQFALYGEILSLRVPKFAQRNCGRPTVAHAQWMRVTAMKPMNHNEFCKAIDALGLTQVGAGRFLGVNSRTCQD